MAIITGEIFNSLIFGGVNSADYGVYITGEATFDAPKRLVEMVSVPGRNGSIAIDQGHWDNIVVEYPAGFFGSDKVDFREALSDFRNAIVSQIGYQRLTDTYHPDEYRTAMYIEGLEVEPVAHNTAGEFKLKFNCKPQRWLTSGETAVTVASGDVLTNPTPYDAGPLLMAEGYGTISFNGYEIELEDATLGTVTLADEITYASKGASRGMARNKLNEGDEITFGGIVNKIVVKSNAGAFTAGSFSISDSNTAFTSSHNWSVGTRQFTLTTVLEPRTFQYSRSSRTWENTATLTATVGSSKRVTITLHTTVNINTANWSISTTRSKSSSYEKVTTSFGNYQIGAVTAESTKTLLGNPTYIDCEIGEAYLISDGEAQSLNQYIALGSDLPVLKSGDNEITIDDTITELKVKPNWWKL